MGKPLKIELSSNAGLIVSCGGVKLLLDCIYDAEGLPFSSPGPERLKAMTEALPPYDGVDYLFFSHGHRDHFSPEPCLEYLRHRSTKALFLPEEALLSHSGLAGYVSDKRIPCVPLSDKTDRAVFSLGPDITVRAISTKHLDRHFRDTVHVCYLFCFDGQNVLFTGDMDYLNEMLPSLKGVRLRAAFVNPLFFSALCRGCFFKGELDAQTLCVFHIPFSADDVGHVREHIARDLSFWDKSKPEVLVLCEQGQEILLS